MIYDKHSVTPSIDSTTPLTNSTKWQPLQYGKIMGGNSQHVETYFELMV